MSLKSKDKCLQGHKFNKLLVRVYIHVHSLVVVFLYELLRLHEYWVESCMDGGSVLFSSGDEISRKLYGKFDQLDFFGYVKEHYSSIRATSHTRLKAHNHCIPRSLIGRKGRDRPNSLHTKMWSRKTHKNYHRWKVYMDICQTIDNVSWSDTNYDNHVSGMTFG
jgi:hypothetical protein